MQTWQVQKRAGLAFAGVVAFVFGMLLVPVAASASKPSTPTVIVDPENPDQYMAQVTPEGSLQVTGGVSVSNLPAVQPVKGTVSVGNFPAVQPVNGSVNVGNFPSVQPVNGTVNVGNFPAVQQVDGTIEVDTPSATAFRRVASGSFDDQWVESFDPIDARFISLTTNDEVTVFFETPGNTIAIEIGSNRAPTQTISLPLIVPLARAGAVCENEADSCFVIIDIIGE
jgi:hypothetical protein